LGENLRKFSNGIVMQQTLANVERITSVNDSYQQVHLAAPQFTAEIKPGHSLLVRLQDTWDPYLRERWWPVALRPQEIIVERPAHIPYQIGQQVSVMGLVGQPLRFKRPLRNVLLMAYDTPPTPLLMSIGWLLKEQVSVSLVLLGTARDYDCEHLPPELEVIEGSDPTTADPLAIGWPKMVMTAGWADQIFVVVHPDDELGRMGRVFYALKNLRAEIPKFYLNGVFQGTVPCGVGACGACQVMLFDHQPFVPCTEGPALDLATLPLPEPSWTPPSV
jgi:hypothetical protein